MTETNKEELRTALLEWYARHKRDLPWRRTRDPYAIWISEIMLQQTRVASTVPFFERFLTRFPNVEALAKAPEPDLLACWAGLGYYHRARNLKKAAQAVCQMGLLPGSMPQDFEEIRKLPGVGSYTAAAVASIGFELPHAVLDGNVFRVLSRIFADATSIATSPARRHFASLADDLLDRRQPGTFNQALMELGATVCLPKNPQCLLCPVAGWCAAKQQGRQSEFPVKIVPRKTIQETRTVYWIERDGEVFSEGQGEVLLWQRPQGSRLMAGFWELPEATDLPGVKHGQLLGTFQHGITFHRYAFKVVKAVAPPDFGACRWRAIADFGTVPVSTIVRKALRVARGKAMAVSR